MKDYKPPRKTLWHFFWYCVELFRNENSMIGYIRENGNVCEDWGRRPSKKLMKRYNLKYDSTLFHWWLMEQYFEGNLILKEKKDVQPIK